MSKLLKLFLAVLIIASCSKKDEEKADYNLTIESADGSSVNLSVENAVSPEELQKGLMNRDTLGEKHGMIFNLKGYEHVAMWMKDTQIPLDMIFVNDGTVVWIYENAQPNSTDIIASPVPANAVVELNAGDVKKYNIKQGDIVKHVFFDNFADESNADEQGDVTSADDEEVIQTEEMTEEEALADDGSSGETVIEETVVEATGENNTATPAQETPAAQ